MRTAKTLVILAVAPLVASCGLLPGRAPTALLSVAPAAGRAPLLVRFDAAESEDDGRIVGYAWDFGDGASQTATASPTAEHLYEHPGKFEACLAVTDEDGLTGERTVTIQVENRDPIPSCRLSNDAPIVGELVVFDATGSLDPDGVVIDFRWEFGDGTSARGSRVSHVYTEIAVLQVRLTIEDDAGGTATIGHTLNVHLPSPGGGCGSR